jgi:hypothetical protein
MTAPPTSQRRHAASRLEALCHTSHVRRTDEGRAEQVPDRRIDTGILPVAIGNLLDGTLFVALPLWYALGLHRRQRQ